MAKSKRAGVGTTGTDAVDDTTYSAGSAITSAQADSAAGDWLDLGLDQDTLLNLPDSTRDSSGPTRYGPSFADDGLTILILGDSYSTTSSPLFRALERELDSSGFDVTLVSKSTNGAVMADGAKQLKAGLKEYKGVDGVLVLLGSNDSLLESSISKTEKKLDKLLAKLDSKGLAALVAGTYGDWPHQGRGYESSGEVNQFEAMFGRQAAKHGDISYDHILDGAYGIPGLTSDGEHPSSAGAQVIAANMGSDLDHLVARAAADPN